MTYKVLYKIEGNDIRERERKEKKRKEKKRQ